MPVQTSLEGTPLNYTPELKQSRQANSIKEKLTIVKSRRGEVRKRRQALKAPSRFVQAPPWPGAIPQSG